MTIRLLPTTTDRPRAQMAADDAMLAVAKDRVLRFYRWRPFGLSLGWFQDEDAEIRRLCDAQKIEIVRRRTGGGAILHAHELTYAIAGPVGTPPFDGDVAKSYELVHEVIIDAFRELGVTLTFAAKANAPAALKRHEQPFYCYARSTALDLCVNAGKVVGSAKRQMDGRALQHGSIVLGAHPLGVGQIGAADVLGREIDVDRLAAMIARGIADRTHARLTPGIVSDAERRHAEAVEHTFAPDFPRRPHA